jgi:hypothetical protein
MRERGALSFSHILEVDATVRASGVPLGDVTAAEQKLRAVHRGEYLKLSGKKHNCDRLTDTAGGVSRIPGTRSALTNRHSENPQ